MPPNITRYVQIILSVSQRGTSSAAGMANLSKGLWGVYRAVREVQLGFGILSRVVNSFLESQNKFEQYKLAIAGLMDASGIVTGWQQATNYADAFVSRMRDAAAVLPGELNEYMEVSKRAYGAIAHSGFKYVEDQVAFIAKYTAIMHTFGIAATTSGNNLFRMLEGRVTTVMPAWTHLKAFIDPKAMANWKSLTNAQRVFEMSKAFKSLQNMIDDSLNKWDSIWGTTLSAFQQIGMIASGPAFDGLKNTFLSINKYMEENQDFLARMVVDAGRLTAILGVGAAVAGIGRGAYGLWTGLPGMISTMSASRSMPSPVTNMLAGSLSPPMGMPSAMANALSLMAKIEWAAMAAAAVALGAAVAGIVTAYMTNAGNFRTEMDRTLDDINNLGGGAGSIFSSTGTVGHFFLYTLPSVVLWMAQKLEPYVEGVGAGAYYVSRNGMIADQNDLLAQTIAKKYGLGYDGLLGNNNPSFGLKGIGNPFGAAYLNAKAAAEKEYAAQYKPLMSWADAKASITSDLDLKAMQAATKKAEDDFERLHPTRHPLTTAKTPKGPGGPVTNFYNSRFNIVQQFDAGADPDRILVGFVGAITALAHRKTESAFSASAL